MAYYRDISGENCPGPDQFIEIFEEFDFTCFESECNFFCPECRDMLQCSTYTEFREEWESFYS